MQCKTNETKFWGLVSLVILVWILFVFGVGFYVCLILLASLVLDFLWDLAVFGFGFFGFGLFYVCGSFGFFAFCLVLVACLVRDLVWELLSNWFLWVTVHT